MSLTPALTTFLKQFDSRRGNSKLWVEIERRPATIEYQSDARLAALTIKDDGRELSLWFGKRIEIPFSPYNYRGETHDTRMAAAAADLAQFSCDVVFDCVLFVLYYSDGGRRRSDGYIGHSHANIVSAVCDSKELNESTFKSRFRPTDYLPTNS